MVYDEKIERERVWQVSERTSCMGKLRNILWKYLGVTLDKQTRILIGVISISCIAAIVFGILAANTGSAVFRVLCVLAFVPVGTIVFGSCYLPLTWSLSSKSERREIEQEVALKQLKRRANDPHFER